MSSCSKVKNPCKICLGPVNQKTGLQCQGVCESWVHYTCLNYTPGKIKDIKTGIIKVTCPCPDCKTTQPKEYRTDEGYSCNNENCPAHFPPKCDNQMCPVNSQFPSVAKMPSKQPCPLSQCGTDCKGYKSQKVPKPCGLYPPRSDNYYGHNNPQGPNNNYGPNNSPGPNNNNDSCPPSSSSEGCPTPPCRVGDTNVYSVSSLSGVEKMCNTVGQLTNQINDLMSQMKQVVARGPGCYPQDCEKCCKQKGAKSKCPKPCYCPGNPAKKI